MEPYRTYDLQELWANIRKRKAELGIMDTDESVDAMRNKGANRTPEKRELLKAIEERCKAAGIKPLKVYF